MEQREALDRVQVCESLFNTLDYDGSGFIDFGELSTVASRATPSKNEKETTELIQTLDANEDGQISREEFVSHLLEKGKEMSDDEFVTAVMVRKRNIDIDTHTHILTLTTLQNTSYPLHLSLFPPLCDIYIYICHASSPFHEPRELVDVWLTRVRVYSCMSRICFSLCVCAVFLCRMCVGTLHAG